MAQKCLVVFASLLHPIPWVPWVTSSPFIATPLPVMNSNRKEKGRSWFEKCKKYVPQVEQQDKNVLWASD